MLFFYFIMIKLKFTWKDWRTVKIINNHLTGVIYSLIYKYEIFCLFFLFIQLNKNLSNFMAGEYSTNAYAIISVIDIYSFTLVWYLDLLTPHFNLKSNLVYNIVEREHSSRLYFKNYLSPSCTVFLNNVLLTIYFHIVHTNLSNSLWKFY
jgi:hypothetical protein